MEIAVIIGVFVGIIAGIVQVVDYYEKKRKKKQSTQKEILDIAQLPSPLTSIIGREYECQKIINLIKNNNQRLITITGEGGIGKTRLALEIGHKLIIDTFSKVIFVDLSSIDNYQLVIPQITKGLGIRETRENIDDQLIRFINKENLLIILDNFEQVIDANIQIRELLEKCPNLFIIITSRISLKILGEHELNISRLSIPVSPNLSSSDKYLTYDSIKLFIERTYKPEKIISHIEDIKNIAEICIHVEGLPLAIELIASQTRSLSIDEILSKFKQETPLCMSNNSFPNRQKNLNATILWSLNLLDEFEKYLFIRLSVFEDDFSIDEIKKIILVGFKEHDTIIVDKLSKFVENNLISSKPYSGNATRYEMRKIFKAFGRNSLRSIFELIPLQHRHALYYLEDAEFSDNELEKGDQIIWLSHMQTNHNNYRSALSFFIKENDFENGCRLAAALGLFWFMRSYFAEGIIWISKFFPNLVLGEFDAKTILNLKILRMAGLLTLGQGKYELTEKLYAYAYQQCKERKEELEIAWIIEYIAVLNYHQEKLQTSNNYFLTALTAFSNLECNLGKAWCYAFLGEIARINKNFDEAINKITKSYNHFATLGDRWGKAQCYEFFGKIYLDKKIFHKANEYFKRSLTYSQRLNFEPKTSVLLLLIAQTEYYLGNYEAVEKYCAKSIDIVNRIGYDQKIKWKGEYILANDYYKSGHTKKSQTFFVKSLITAKEFTKYNELVRSLFGLGEVLFIQGHSQKSHDAFMLANLICTYTNTAIPSDEISLSLIARKSFEQEKLIESNHLKDSLLIDKLDHSSIQQKLEYFITDINT